MDKLILILSQALNPYFLLLHSFFSELVFKKTTSLTPYKAQLRMLPAVRLLL